MSNGLDGTRLAAAWGRFQANVLAAVMGLAGGAALILLWMLVVVASALDNAGRKGKALWRRVRGGGGGRP